MDATLRFISFALGENNLQKLKKVFCTSLTIHIGLAIIIFIIAETFGIWFVNVKLNINPERMIAANWVYQCSIITLLVTIINIPYRSCIVAHEHMHIYAYFSIIEVYFNC
jgi:Na+-driven multidrug efflux pump